MLSLKNLKKLSVYALLLWLGVAGVAVAKEGIKIDVLPHASNPNFDLDDVAGKVTFYDYMHSDIGQEMLRLAPSAGPKATNETKLKKGEGVSVRLSDTNYNIHINFPAKAHGGRSYGWTKGVVGDWSDEAYLRNLATVMKSKDRKDISNFYETLIQILGACNAAGIESLKPSTQPVLSNFLAIFTAEQYRSMVPNNPPHSQPHFNWDEALLETTLLGSFHAGQTKFTKVYVNGEFSDKSREQAIGVYNRNTRGKTSLPGPNFNSAQIKNADMTDYWQFSLKALVLPNGKEIQQSGINITRKDFEAMGGIITRYYSAPSRKNAALETIKSIVGSKKGNAISELARYFTDKNAPRNIDKTEELSIAVSTFMLNLYDDADNITKWKLNGEK